VRLDVRRDAALQRAERPLCPAVDCADWRVDRELGEEALLGYRKALRQQGYSRRHGEHIVVVDRSTTAAQPGDRAVTETGGMRAQF
jgi:hypothetical protein